jgi:hypothetical protein
LDVNKRIERLLKTDSDENAIEGTIFSDKFVAMYLCREIARLD